MSEKQLRDMMTKLVVLLNSENCNGQGNLAALANSNVSSELIGLLEEISTIKEVSVSIDVCKSAVVDALTEAFYCGQHEASDMGGDSGFNAERMAQEIFERI